MNVRISVIVENTTDRATLLAEHGLAYWIESNGKLVLFDTGQGLTLVSNAFKLGIPLFEASAIVLSHGHYDHTGGLAAALRNNTKGRVFAHPAAIDDKFARTNTGVVKTVGFPFESKRCLRQRSHLWVKTERPTAVWEGLMVTGPIPRRTDFEDTGGPFYLDAQCQRPDPLVDDQALFFETPQGTVVLLGCAHAGVINTLRYVLALTDNRPLHAVLGGMHLVHASTERVSRTTEEFQRLGVEILGPAHCTGRSAVAALSSAFPGQILACDVGSQFEFEVLPPKPDVTSVNGQQRSSAATSQSMVGASVQS
jgi:7,8-dihydropterin-6-yl-methyl-4-(beta-D-ribofuranosyl)aminobenzene 5'-phosphate synthase